MRLLKKPAEPADIELYQEAWVAGTRAKTHFGPISAEIFVDDKEPGRRSEWLKALLELLERLRNKARVLCANAVVNLEITLDPFAYSNDGARPGVRLSAQGTAVILESLAPRGGLRARSRVSNP